MFKSYNLQTIKSVYSLHKTITQGVNYLSINTCQAVKAREAFPQNVYPQSDFLLLYKEISSVLFLPGSAPFKMISRSCNKKNCFWPRQRKSKQLTEIYFTNI